jgi:glutamate--cysteine ligase
LSIEVKKILAELIDSKRELIEDWFAEKYGKTPKLFYSSVDIRHSGYKLSPVDTNLFPAGFNLLSELQKEKASEYVKNYFYEQLKSKKNLILIAENHTRNKYYLENIYCLQKIIIEAGINVKLGMLGLGEGDDSTIILETISGKNLQINKIIRDNDKLCIDNFIADAVLVNNDLSSGSPEILKDLRDTPIFPPIGLGWYQRRKSSHFETYDQVAREFGREFGFDHWLISGIFSKCGKIDFKNKDGLYCVAENVEKTIFKISEKYKEYEIKDEPYVFVKANSGTYGMGIMSVRSGEEIIDINKKNRKNMSNIKEGVANTEVVIQEGIKTIDKIEDAAAEPLVYLVNSMPVGCTYRVNKNKDNEQNLNSPGMVFHNFESLETESNVNCPAQGLIARIASLAAARECYEMNWTI